MPLELSLVIKGDESGAVKAVDNTANRIENLGNKVKTASTGVETAVDNVTTKAPEAVTAVEKVGTAVETVKTKFGGWEAAAIGGIAGVAGALGSALLEAAVSAAIDLIGGYFDEITNSAANIEADIEAHKTLIGSIKGLWEQNKNAASDYGNISLPGIRFEAQDNVQRLGGDYDSALSRFVAGSSTLRPGKDSPFAGLVAGLRQDLADGKADIIAWYNEITAIGQNLELDDPARAFVRQFREDSAEVREVQTKLNEALDAYGAVTGNAEAATRAFGDNGAKVVELAGQYEAALPAMREFAALQAAIGAGGRMDTIGATGFGFSDIAGSGFGSAPAKKDGGWLSWLGFADGGYTGHQPTDEIAGFVHGKEYVFDAASTAAIGVGNLDAIRRGVKGYATGGGVGIPAITSPIGNGSFGFDLAGSFSLLKGVALDLASALRSTKDSAGAVDTMLGNLAGKFLSAAGSMFDKANPGLGGIGGLLASLFGGFFADGGAMQAGKFYAVGERGPELFAPGMSGTMIPNHALGGGGGFTQNIRNYSGQPIKTSERRQPDGSVVQDLVIGTVKRGIADDEFRSNGLRGPTKSR